MIGVEGMASVQASLGYCRHSLRARRRGRVLTGARSLFVAASCRSTPRRDSPSPVSDRSHPPPGSSSPDNSPDVHESQSTVTLSMQLNTLTLSGPALEPFERTWPTDAALINVPLPSYPSNPLVVDRHRIAVPRQSVLVLPRYTIYVLRHPP